MEEQTNLRILDLNVTMEWGVEEYIPEGASNYGSAQNALIVASSVLTSAILTGGLAVLTARYRITGSATGVALGSSAVKGIQPAISGGTKINGSAITKSVRFNLGSGGVALAGECDVDFYDNIVGMVGTVLGGSALISYGEVHYEASGTLVIGGECRTSRLKFYRYRPDGRLVTINGISLASYGLHYQATGDVHIGGESATGITSYRYIATGNVKLRGLAGTQFNAVVLGGASLGGTAKVNTADFSYTASGGVLTEHSNETLTEASYRYRPTGKVRISGTAILAWNRTLLGGSVLGGSAVINRLNLRYIATGGLTLAGNNQIIEAALVFPTRGSVRVGGEATTKRGNYEYVATGGLRLGGNSDFSATFVALDCVHSPFRCVVQYLHPNIECPNIRFYFCECEVYLDDKFCETISGAIVPPVVACRQRMVMPSMDRRPDIPKRRR